MKEATVYLLLLLKAAASAAQSVINATSGNNFGDIERMGNATADNWDRVDYAQMLRDGIAHGFSSVPKSLKLRLLQADVRPECKVGLLRTLRGFMNLEPWTLRLLDASGKLPSGLLQATRADMGAFDECLDTVLRDQYGSVLMHGQYCNLLIYVKDGGSMKEKIDAFSDVIHRRLVDFKDYVAYKDLPAGRLGICFTDECSQADMQAIVDTVKPPLVRLEVSNCVTAEPEPWTTTQIGIGVFLGVLLLVLIIATVVDNVTSGHKERKKQSAPLVFLMAFSLASNTRDLLKVADKSRADQYALQFLHGIRFLCIIHIVVGHLYTTIGESWSNLLNMFIAAGEWTHMIPAAGANSVDTFFFLSGFFLCLTVCRRRNGSIQFIILSVIKRLIRVCVPLFFVIMCLCLLEQFVAGPDAKTFFQRLH